MFYASFPYFRMCFFSLYDQISICSIFSQNDYPDLHQVEVDSIDPEVTRKLQEDVVLVARRATGDEEVRPFL